MEGGRGWTDFNECDGGEGVGALVRWHELCSRIMGQTSVSFVLHETGGRGGERGNAPRMTPLQAGAVPEARGRIPAAAYTCHPWVLNPTRPVRRASMTMLQGREKGSFNASKEGEHPSYSPPSQERQIEMRTVSLICRLWDPRWLLRSIVSSTRDRVRLERTRLDGERSEEGVLLGRRRYDPGGGIPFSAAGDDFWEEDGEEERAAERVGGHAASEQVSQDRGERWKGKRTGSRFARGGNRTVDGRRQQSSSTADGKRLTDVVGRDLHRSSNQISSLAVVQPHRKRDSAPAAASAEHNSSLAHR